MREDATKSFTNFSSARWADLENPWQALNKQGFKFGIVSKSYIYASRFY